MTPEIGDRVVIYTNGRLKWADGKTGTIVSCNGWVESEECYQVTVKGDGMDPMKPPYGMITVRNYEVEPEQKSTAQTDIQPDDPVNHPNHYTDGKYECIDYMESAGYIHNGYLFNAVKYISRAGKKDPDKYDEDLKKAIWYLERNEESKARVCEKIHTEDYIHDKGLEGTLRGIALELIAERNCRLAAKILQMELDTHEKQPL